MAASALLEVDLPTSSSARRVRGGRFGAEIQWCGDLTRRHTSRWRMVQGVHARPVEAIGEDRVGQSRFESDFHALVFISLALRTLQSREMALQTHESCEYLRAHVYAVATFVSSDGAFFVHL